MVLVSNRKLLIPPESRQTMLQIEPHDASAIQLRQGDRDGSVGWYVHLCDFGWFNEGISVPILVPYCDLSSRTLLPEHLVQLVCPLCSALPIFAQRSM